MNPEHQLNRQQITTPKWHPHLLDTIKTIRASVGDGLNDDELTRLLRETTLLSEAGFCFLSFSCGVVTLTVPEQDLTSWYPQKGWIAPQKEQLARAIAQKYELSLYVPVDAATSFWHPPSDPPAAHHHLELTDHWQTVVVIHPHYLKVRLYGKSSALPHLAETLCPLQLDSNLLRDLSALYMESSGSNFEPPSR